jgi:hypothetical protein
MALVTDGKTVAERRSTAYLKNGGTMEKAEQKANHASMRTTRIYDHRQTKIEDSPVCKVVY